MKQLFQQNNRYDILRHDRLDIIVWGVGEGMGVGWGERCTSEITTGGGLTTLLPPGPK